jgi:hypothetical protein
MHVCMYVDLSLGRYVFTHAHAHAIFVQPAKEPPATLSGSRREALHPNYYTHHLFWMTGWMTGVCVYGQFGDGGKLCICMYVDTCVG